MTTPTIEQLRAYVVNRLHQYPALNLHLVSAHCNGAALGMTEAQALDSHDHEHHGPGGIRNHDEDDLFWDAEKVATVIIECADMALRSDDEDDFAIKRAVADLMRRPSTILRSTPDEHVHIAPDAVADWDGAVCEHGMGCTDYPRQYDLRIERTPEGRLTGAGSTSMDNSADDIARCLSGAHAALVFAAAVASDPDRPDPGLLRIVEEGQAKLRCSLAMLSPRLYPENS